MGSGLVLLINATTDQYSPSFKTDTNLNSTISLRGLQVVGNLGTAVLKIQSVKFTPVKIGDNLVPTLPSVIPPGDWFDVVLDKPILANSYFSISPAPGIVLYRLSLVGSGGGTNITASYFYNVA